MTTQTTPNAFAIVQRVDASESVVVLRARLPGHTVDVVLAAIEEGPARVRGVTGVLARKVAQQVWGARLPSPPSRQRNRGLDETLHRARIVHVNDDSIELVNANAKDPTAVACAEPEPCERALLHVHRGRIVLTPQRIDSPTDGAVPTSRARFFSAEHVVSEAEKPTDPVVASQPPRSFVDIVVADDRTQLDALERRGFELAKALASRAVDQTRERAHACLKKASERIGRRIHAIGNDLASIDRASAVAAQAPWLLHQSMHAPRGTTQLCVTDWSTGVPTELTVRLDPSKSPREQVEAMFAKSKRLKQGAVIANERLSASQLQLATISNAIEHLVAAPSVRDIAEIMTAAAKAAPHDVRWHAGSGVTAAGDQTRPTEFSDAASAQQQGQRRCYRTFTSTRGSQLWVGKGAADNDVLCTKLASPHDLWVHAKNQTGAHVIVRLAKKQTCSPEDLIDAAHLAAHFSSARGERTCEVQYTPKRYVRKPKGSPPGLVLPTREKVFVLRVDETRVRGLLEREIPQT